MSTLKLRKNLPSALILWLVKTRAEISGLRHHSKTSAAQENFSPKILMRMRRLPKQKSYSEKWIIHVNLYSYKIKYTFHNLSTAFAAGFFAKFKRKGCRNDPFTPTGSGRRIPSSKSLSLLTPENAWESR